MFFYVNPQNINKLNLLQVTIHMGMCQGKERDPNPLILDLVVGPLGLLGQEDWNLDLG